MTAPVRPRRSVLYMPGSNARALAKARTLPADALILDLEDAVAPAAKDEAREQIVAALAEGGYGGREVVVRINGLETEWGGADMAAIAKTAADAILIPKVEGKATVAEVERAMEMARARHEMAIWCMIETALGVLHAEEIAGSSDRIAALVMGTSDLAKDLHCLHTPMRLPLIASLNICVLAARAYGLAIVDGVHLDLADADGFAQACVQGRELGFDGKTLIHPKTIEEANEVFAPSPGDVEWSRRIIAAHREAAAEGKGMVLVDGKLIENLHVEEAHRLVELAAAIAALQAAG
ncbi:MAG: CoA ester lyase [Alphaproteobacteria bacterium]|jgi:citrate lyase subunit beta/citryl-CoA lyase|nr:CoA ester lyase [Alphaproteobacteria bacterium]